MQLNNFNCKNITINYNLNNKIPTIDINKAKELILKDFSDNSNNKELKVKKNLSPLTKDIKGKYDLYKGFVAYKK